jgi:hypothetical protein
LLVERRRSVQMNVDVVAQRVRAEFEEMPDLTLTVPQAARLFGIETDLCRSVVEKLIDSEHLRWTREGAVTCGKR